LIESLGFLGKFLKDLYLAWELLWSAIERYAGLKYHLGERATNKVYRIAKEIYFADSLKKNVKSEIKVFSVIDLKYVTLNPNDPMQSLKYYYQIRSNTVHRGKAMHGDFSTLRYWGLGRNGT
jgi:hypothetical protein